MSLIYTVDTRAKLVTIVGTGKVTATDLLSLIRRIAVDPAYLPNLPALVDMRKAVFESRRRGDILDVARRIEETEAFLKSHIAIVARAATLLTAELMSAHIRAAKHISIRVFLDISAAMNFCAARKETRSGHKIKRTGRESLIAVR